MTVMQVLSLALTVILAENIVLTGSLGAGPFLRTTGEGRIWLWTGLLMTGIMTLFSVLSWLMGHMLLTPLGLERLLLLADILLLGLLGLGMQFGIKKLLPGAYQVLGKWLPLVTVNSAVLGVALLSGEGCPDLRTAALYGLFSALGFLLVSALFASVRERLRFSKCPKAFEGYPIALVTAALLAMAFMGFSGLKILP